MENKIRVLIVDDEILARKLLRRMLQDDASIEIIGECRSGCEALQAIKDLTPDLLFLDVQMPKMDGFAVLKELNQEQLPLVIFVTAYDSYAIRAFEVHALDYLLKPFDDQRFEQSLQRAKAHIQSKESVVTSKKMLSLLEELKAKNDYLQRLVITTGGRVIFLRTVEVDWIQANDNYLRLHTKKTIYLMRDTIRNLETQLDPNKFLRINRSCIVNLDSILELQPMFHGDYRIVLHNGTQLTLSRRYRGKASGLLKKL